MSRTSSDPPAGRGGASSTPSTEAPAPSRVAAASYRLRLQRERRRFDRAFWVLVATLGAASAVFLLLGTLQGPKLSSALVDPLRVTEQPGQQLRLFANQPLAAVSADQISISPEATVTATVQDDVLIVQFEQPLRAGTEYTVEVRDVGALSRDATSTFVHRFTTAEASVLYLDRGETVDEVLRAPLSGTGRGEVVLAAEGIQHIAPVEGVIVVARDAPGGTSVLEAIAADRGVQRITLPEGVRVDQLVTPPLGGLVGLVLSTPGAVPGDPTTGYSRALAVVDLVADSPVTIVESLDGSPIQTLFAQFLPDGTTMIAHQVGGTLLRVELVPAPLVLPVGQIPTAFGLSTDATRLTGSDAFGGVVVDLDTGRESRLDPSPVDGAFAFGGPALLTRGELRVQKVAVPDPVTGAVATLLVADDGTGAARVLFRTVDDRGSLGDLVLSANDQYVAVEVTPSVADAEPDGRPVNGRPTSVTTVIVDIATGAVVRTLEGFAPHF